MNESVIMPVEEFELLPKEEKIRLLREWIRIYKVKGIIKEWDLKYPPNYYIKLKKMGIYQEIVGNNRKSRTDQWSRFAAYPQVTSAQTESGQRNQSVPAGQSGQAATKRSAGIIRKIDELGRIVIPQETRSLLGISTFDALEVYTDEETEEIMVKKYSPGCIQCSSFDHLVTIKQKQLCRNCLNEFLASAEANVAAASETNE